MSAQIELDGFDHSSLKGKSALILGGGSGSGLATALALAKAGAKVTVADILPHDSIISHFQSRGLGIQYVKCDVTFWQQQVMAFKQAIHFAPHQSLDLVCCFAAVDKRQCLVESAKQDEPRIDEEPSALSVEELEVNLKGVFDSTRLALHYFRVPDRATTMRRTRPDTPSSASSITRSSARSRSPSRSGSRRRSRSRTRSRSGSPIPPPPPPPDDVGPTEAGSSTEKKEGTSEDSEETKNEKETLPIKCLIIVSGLSAYVDDGHSSLYSASNFALRGLFRSIRTKAREELGVRVNLVAPWALRTPMLEPFLKKLEEDGVIEREEASKAISVQAEEPDDAEQKENIQDKEKAEDAEVETTTANNASGPGSRDQQSDDHTMQRVEGAEVKEEQSNILVNGHPAPQTEPTEQTGSLSGEVQTQATAEQAESSIPDTQTATIEQTSSTASVVPTVAMEQAQPPTSEVQTAATAEQLPMPPSEVTVIDNAEQVQQAAPQTEQEAVSSTEQQVNQEAVSSTAEPSTQNGVQETEADTATETDSKETKAAEATTPSNSQPENESGIKLQPTSSEITFSPSTINNNTETTNKDTQIQYKNMHFTSLEAVAKTVTRLCADPSMSGRAIAVLPEGSFDLQDDHQGNYAGDQVRKLLDTRRSKGDLICDLLYR